MNGTVARILLPLTLVSLSGCADVTVSEVGAGHPLLRGAIHGGQQPIKGAVVQLYAVGTAGDRSASRPLIASPPLTDAHGGFDVSGLYSCPSADALVYLVAFGGDPGVGENNPASVLMAALGPCGGLNALSYVTVNEVTTVASIFPLAGFMSSYRSLGSGVGDATNLTSGFAAVNRLVDIGSGTSPGPAFTTGLTVPTGTINTLANIIATCVNSIGGLAGDGSDCGSLFADATPASGVAPTNTADALVEIAQNPTRHVSDLFSLAPATVPYQPTLTNAPANWSVFATPNMVERPTLLAEYLLNEGSGNVAHDTSGLGNDASINGPSWEGSADLNFDNLFEYMQMPVAVNAAKTFQFAAYFPVFGGATLPQAPGYGWPSSYGANASIFCGTDPSQLCLLANSINGAKAFSFFASNTDGTEASVPIAPGWHVFTLICGGNSGGVVSKTHYLYDGTEVSGYLRQGDVNTCPVPGGGNYQFGGSSLFYYSWFMGKLGGAWAWSKRLTVAEAATAASGALNFIQSKGVVTSFSNASNNPVVLIGGLDSRTYGAGVSPQTVWLQTMNLNDASLRRVNLGIPGQYAYDACNQFDLTYGEQIPISPAPAITVLWGGVNDFLYSSQTPQQVAASLQCLVKKAKAAGSRVIIATEISFVSRNSYSLSGDANKNALDTIIRANAFAWGVDNIADLATDSHVGADGASASNTCFVDGVHPGEACEPYITSIMQDAVNELLGSTALAPRITAASLYQELAGDDFLTLNGSSAQTVSLPSCIGYALPRMITNTGANSANVATSNSELLAGSTVLGPGVVATVVPVPGPVTIGGCSWNRTK